MLTGGIWHDRMQLANSWVRSSMVEQWPFKPLVESSSLSALTQHMWRFYSLLPLPVAVVLTVAALIFKVSHWSFFQPLKADEKQFNPTVPSRKQEFIDAHPVRISLFALILKPLVCKRT
jgi:hypothetical protein